MDEEEIEDLDSETEEEELDPIEEEPAGEPADDDDEDVETLRRKNASLYARAKKAEAALKQPKVETAPAKEKKTPASEDAINRILDQRELEALELDDELKQEIKDYAKLKGISIKKATQSPYITFRKEDYDTKQRAEDAAIGSKRSGKVKTDYSNFDATVIDPRTKEGAAELERYEEYMRKQLG